MRVGSRAMRSSVLTAEEMKPAIIPKESWLAKLYISFHHNAVKHQGRLFTQSSLRQAGIWIPGAQGLIKSFIRDCTVCRKLRGTPATQLMGELPAERVEPSPAFSHIGVDTFGPFTVKERRSEIKRWCIIFTCMYSRAIHIEVVNDLSTDSFLQALRCLECIRGPVSTVFSDCGTNFIGANTQLNKMLSESEDQLSAKRINFKTNTPGGSHQGGVWERIIRSIKAIFNQMAPKYLTRLDTAGLRSTMLEITDIINNKPLTADSIDYPSEHLITPNQLLPLKSGQRLPPPGNLMDSNVYGTSMYRRSQRFAEEYWKNWRDYLASIERRSKWKTAARNVEVGDIVTIIEENATRNDWKMGTVVDVKKGEDGLVRSASVRVVDHKEIRNDGKRSSPPSILDRPIQKLIVVTKQQD